MIKLKDPLGTNRAKPITCEEDENGCYICTSHAKKYDGRYYGIKRKGKMLLLHRYVYESYFDEIPDEMVVRHKCDNDLCVNPNHLEIGTHQDNARDKVDRGRHSYIARKLSKEDIEKVKSMIEDGKTQTEIAKLFNVDQGTISNLLRGKYYKNV